MQTKVDKSEGEQTRNIANCNSDLVKVTIDFHNELAQVNLQMTTSEKQMDECLTNWKRKREMDENSIIESFHR
jgi:hypothetical protein